MVIYIPINICSMYLKNEWIKQTFYLELGCWFTCMLEHKFEWWIIFSSDHDHHIRWYVPHLSSLHLSSYCLMYVLKYTYSLRLYICPKNFCWNLFLAHFTHAVQEVPKTSPRFTNSLERFTELHWTVRLIFTVYYTKMIQTKITN